MAGFFFGKGGNKKITEHTMCCDFLYKYVKYFSSKKK
jgi:hypothetical protein